MFKQKSIVSSVMKINGCLYDSKEVKSKMKKMIKYCEVCLIFFSYFRRLTSPLLSSSLSRQDPVESLEPQLPFTESPKAERFCHELCRKNVAGLPLNPDAVYPEFPTMLW